MLKVYWMKNKCSKAFCECKRIIEIEKKCHRELQTIHLFWKFKNYSDISVSFVSFIVYIITPFSIMYFYLKSSVLKLIIFHLVSTSCLTIDFRLHYQQKFLPIRNADHLCHMQGIINISQCTVFDSITFSAILILSCHLLLCFPWFFSSFHLPVLSSSRRLM